MNNLVILLFISLNVLTGVRNLPAEPVVLFFTFYETDSARYSACQSLVENEASHVLKQIFPCRQGQFLI